MPEPTEPIHTKRKKVNPAYFNPDPLLVHELRIEDFSVAMQDVYDFFYDVNVGMERKSLPRLEETIRGAILSGTISDMLTVCMAKHARSLVKNNYPNGHPDLILRGKAVNDAAQSGIDGVEIKSTKHQNASVDFHGARAQWVAVFVWEVDEWSEPAIDRRPLRFTQVYLSRVGESDFRSNARNTAIGTRTASLHAEGLARMRRNWIYRDPEPSPTPPPETRATAPHRRRARRTSR